MHKSRTCMRTCTQQWWCNHTISEHVPPTTDISEDTPPPPPSSQCSHSPNVMQKCPKQTLRLAHTTTQEPPQQRVAPHPRWRRAQMAPHATSPMPQHPAGVCNSWLKCRHCSVEVRCLPSPIWHTHVLLLTPYTQGRPSHHVEAHNAQHVEQPGHDPPTATTTQCHHHHHPRLSTSHLQIRQKSDFYVTLNCK